MTFNCLSEVIGYQKLQFLFWVIYFCSSFRCKSISINALLHCFFNFEPSLCNNPSGSFRAAMVVKAKLRPRTFQVVEMTPAYFMHVTASNFLFVSEPSQ